MTNRKDFETGRRVAAEIGLAAMRPSPAQLKSAAKALGLSVAAVRRALDTFIWN